MNTVFAEVTYPKFPPKLTAVADLPAWRTPQDSAKELSLRDRFAMAALPVAAISHNTSHPRGWLQLAMTAYSIADGMIEARKS